MLKVRQTELYADWFSGLRDRTLRARIDIRIRRLSMGNPGKVNAVGEGVSELKLEFGPGYRIYFFQHGNELVFLLAGGDKASQAKDIKMALQLARDL